MPENSKEITKRVIISSEENNRIKKEIKNISHLKKAIEELKEQDITRLVETILLASIYLDISDIHLEPKKENAKLRARIDGVLHDILELDLKIYGLLTSRIKLVSGLKLNIFNQPQDGRFSLLVEKNSIEIRTSSLPSEYGETLVLRILNPKWIVNMESLGLGEDMFRLFSEQLKKPNGMILCTGPTGSGKTTTLYAFLQKVIDPKIKIITIEDPIEYHLASVSQSQVDEKKGYTFANGLRAIVRQDPDVILVGEIRDFETAQISLQAALTGHLVFSTIHTNDAAGTIARIQSLGEKAVNIAPAINLIIGQRLVRKICQKCAKFEKPLPKTLELLKKELSSLDKKELSSLKIPKAIGCEKCNSTGYRGRIGIYEAFLVDDEMEKFILTSPSITEVREFAIKKGMVLMRANGLIKVLEGITTIEEVERITGE